MTCPACGSTRSRPAFVIGAFEFRRCRACGTLAVPAPPDPAVVAGLYLDRSYFGGGTTGPSDRPFGYRDYVGDRQHIEAKFDRILAVVERLRAPGQLLDVGAGPGFLVGVAARRGWDAHGIEPNRWAVEEARRRGLSVRRGTFAAGAVAAHSLDAITMTDVIEHVPVPSDLVEAAASSLRDGGVLAVLTPDASSLVGRVLGRRWPEVARVPEHLVVFSRRGLAALLRRHGFEPVEMHTVGKRSSLSVLLGDAEHAVPRLVGPVRRALARTRAGSWVIELDPRTKICVYARKVPGSSGRSPAARPLTRSQRRPTQGSLEASGAHPAAGHVVVEEERNDLELLRGAERYQRWILGAFGDAVRGDVLEVGPGIGNLTRLIAGQVDRLVVAEPEEAMRAELPTSLPNLEVIPSRFESLAETERRFDCIVLVNVLEHIADDGAALRLAAHLLRPGGRACVLVPAHPGLFSEWDRRVGHFRRYTRAGVVEGLRGAGLSVEGARYFNPIGVAGWFLVTKVLRRTHLSRGAVILSERVAVPLGLALERLGRPPFGLSVVAVGLRP